MDPKLLELLLKAGEFSGREDVPEDVKELLGQLAAAVATGAAPAGEVEESPPASADPEEEPLAPPAVEEEPAPMQRASIDAVSARAKQDAAKAADYAAKALKAAETRYREELFAGAPDVFPEAMPKTREEYKNAKPEEIERHIKATRMRTVAPKPQEAPAARSRRDPNEPREPLPEQLKVNNPGGLMIFAGGNKRVS